MTDHLEGDRFVHVVLKPDGSVPVHSWRFDHSHATKLAAECAMLAAAILIDPPSRAWLCVVCFRRPVLKSAPALILEVFENDLTETKLPGLRKRLHDAQIAADTEKHALARARGASRSSETVQPPSVDAKDG